MGTGDDGYNATYGRTFTGDIQEIIVLSVPSASSFNPTEMNKITSYLAIKYGQSLEGNFVLTNSVGTELWSKITHSSYSNNVFGLGRDDITGLNQKQSVNVEDDVLTAYLGNTLHSISAQNLVHFSEDKTYLLFGSNALNGISSYTYLDGTQFKNKTLTGESFTRRQSRIYKAIHSGSNDSLRVSLRIKHMKAKYVMVSNDASFLPAETRLYPVVDGVASGVAFKGESYVGFVLYGETPDGQATGITTNLWLKADEVQAGEQPADGAALTRWTNSTGILYRDFVQSGTYAVPVYKTDGVNYHPAVRFNTMRLISEQSINYLANVHKRAFYMSTRGATAANHHATLFSYNTHETSLTIEGWRNNQFFLTNYHSDGKMTGDLNKTSGIIRTYRPYIPSSDGIGLVAHNAKRYNIAGSVNYGQFDGNYSPLIGTARRATTDHALIGDIQEFILLEEATSASPAAVANRENKITTYLAVKYGQTLDATDQPQWLTSGNVPIWNAADPNYTSYNKNIFGIGRDDSTTLYQKQSMSAGAIERITVFLGSPILPKLNRQNTGTLENNNFLMFGSNGINPNLSSSHASYIKSAGTTYANSVSLSLNLTHRHKFTLRAKKTGVQQYTVNFCINGVRADYLLVCPDQSFEPSNTRAYPLDGNFVASDVTVTDGDYIGFAFLQKAPGGVASSIRMWLKADEPSSIDLHSTGELQEWRDVSGNPDNIKYSYLQPKTHNKRPGFRKIDPAMNYHPAADFRSLHEFLSTDQAPFSIRNPKQYSFVSVMNIRKFGDNVSGYCNVNENYSYVLGFGWKDTGGDDHENPGGGDENNNRRPGIGFANVNNKGIGRAFFGYDGKYYLNGNKGLYNGNATTASMHIVDVSGQDASTAYMRFEADGEYDHIMQSGGKPEPCSGNGDRTYTELVQQMYNQHHATKHHILMNGAGTLGTGSRSPRQMYGTLGELIAYEGILTDLEKNKVYSYLGLKYGITLDLNKSNADINFDYFLSDGTTYVWRGTNDATHRKYHNNVAAIVRDDAANLNNLQSHSTDNGAVVLMGIGERIGLEPQLRGLDEDKEFIVWGNNGIGLNQKEEYLPDPLNPERCGDFNDKLRRIWFVDVKTHKDYSVHIGAFLQPNAVGAEAQFPFNGRNHQVFMLIADSEDKILNNNWDMYIEGTYLDGMHQFNFTFEHGKQYYFTFGGKIKEGATPDCEGCPSNSKIKTLNYAGWTNRQISYTRDLASSTDPFNVDVNVAFVPPAGTSTIVGAPSLHYNNRPMNTSGALSLWRTGSGTSGKNIMRTRYTMPKSAIVSFRILEIDYYLGRYNNVEIYGYCGESGTKIFPKLSYVTTPANSTFVIYPNGRASARRIGLLSANNIRGWMNVSFDEPVKEVYFDHWLTGSTSGAKRIAISSLNFNCPSEPPPVNNEGLAFVTRASEYDDVPLCKEVTYTFLITNTSCTPRKVAFNDVLPSGMFWVDGTLNIDPAIVTNNGANVYANSQTLTIDSIFVAGGQTTSFSINAGFADNASEGAYSSQAHIQYKRYIGTALTNIDLPSCDNYKPECQPTVINAIISGDRLNPLTVSPLLVDKTCFKAGDTLTVSFSVSNPNTTNAILQAGLSVNYNGTFTFEPGSLTTDLLDVGTPDFYPEGDGFDLNGISNAGFEIPASATRNISFKLIAPTSSEILLDEDGNPVRDEGGQPVYAPLTIAFGFSSFAEDDCSLALFEHAYGDKEVPVIPNFKITGKNPLCIGENSQVSLWSNGVLSSANPFVATIGNDGKITAVSAGKTVFYFQSTSLGSDCKAVSDTLVVAAPTITGENQICVNNSITLTAAENGSWTSSDTYKATVNPTTGEVTGIAAGSTTITFTSDGGNCTATHIVTVVAPQQITDFYYSSSSFCSTDFPVAPTFSPPGGTFSVSGGAGTLDLNSSTGEITFTNSDPGVYTVSYTLSPEGCVPVSADFQVTVLNCGDLNLFKDVNTQNICYKDATKRDTVIFTITVDNTSGGSAFNNVEVTEVWDDRFEYFSHNASDGLYDHTTKIWTLGTVIDGQTSTLTIKAVPKNSATASGVNKVFVSRQESTTSATYEAATVKDEVSTNIYPFPTISITNPNDLCISGGGVQISASPTGGTFSGGAFVSSTGILTPSIAGIGVHKVYYTFTNQNGCSSTDSIEVVVSGCTQAINDTVMTVIDQPLMIDVLANDNYPDCNRIDVANSLSFPQQGKHGAATKNVDGTITYTPTAGFFGIDTLTYRINCGNESTATVYIVVLKPGAFSYIACPDATVKLSMAEMQNSWSPQAWVNYKWYDTQTEGTEIIAGVSGTYGETLTHTKTTDNLEVFWLEAKWNNIIFPRYKVELRKSDDCGTTIPTGCAVTGTVLFKEDYGGNAPNDDEISQTGLPSDVTTYTFCNTLSCGGSGWYKLKKTHLTEQIASIWHHDYDDHTYPNDPQKGYFFGVDANSDPDKFYEYKIEGLCSNTELYFSAWLANLVVSEHTTATDEPRLRFELSNKYGVVLTEYNTGIIPRTNQASGLQWAMYGFDFNTGNNDEIIMRIYSDGTGSSGNDFVMDDIEIRLCVPKVTIGSPDKSDTAVCIGQELVFNGSYEDVLKTLGEDLVAAWVYSATDSSIPDDWTIISESIIDAPNSAVISSTYPIGTITNSHEGYYRMVVTGAGNVDPTGSTSGGPALKKSSCVAMSHTLHVIVIGEMNGGSLNYNDTVCYNAVPSTALQLTGVSGDQPPYTYLWQYKKASMSDWGDITNSTDSYTLPADPLNENVMYRVKTSGSWCGSALSDTARIVVRPASMLRYPDVRIYACPSASPVNLSKFIDSLGITDLQWSAATSVSPAIDADGIIAGNALQSGATYTYTYKITNSCVSNTVSKVYLHVLTQNQNFRLRTDTVAVCYTQANNLQINRMFGLDDGSPILYNQTPVSGGNSVETHIVKSIAPSKYAGALIFNGSDAYNATNVLPTINYHGDNNAKYMEFVYTTNLTGCLGSKTYKVVVVLTSF